MSSLQFPRLLVFLLGALRCVRRRSRFNHWLEVGIALSLWPMQSAGAWPTSMQPSFWLDQPWARTVLLGLALIWLALFCWLFIARLLRNQSRPEPSKPADLWPHLVHAVAAAKTLDGLLRASADTLVGHFHAERVWLAKYSASRNRWFPIKISGPRPDHTMLSPSDELSSGLHTIIAELKSIIVPGRVAGQAGRHSSRNWLFIPIGSNRGNLTAIALSWKGLSANDTELLRAVEPIREFLSRSVADLVSSSAADTIRISTRLSEDLARKLDRHTTVESTLGTLVESLWPICRQDYVALSAIDTKSQQEVRWSAMVEQGRAIERQYPILASGNGGTPPGRHWGKPTIAVDLATDPSSAGSIESRLGMRSQLTMPLVWAGKVLGRLTVAQRQPGRFDDVTRVRLEPLVQVLAEWLQVRQTERLAGRMDRYLDALDRLDRLEDEDRDTITALLRHAMDVTAVRLFRYDPTEEAFHLAGSAYARPVGERGGLHLTAPAERLPWLRFALREDRPCLIDQNDPERLMSAEESRLAMLERFKTGLLMPLRLNRQSVGVLSAVEMRHPARRRFEGADYVFLRCAASRIAGLMAAEHPQTAKRSERPQVRPAAPLLAAPLTTIYGSVDLIRQNLDGLDERTARYLNNIERAAERIKEFGYQAEAVTFSHL